MNAAHEVDGRTRRRADNRHVAINAIITLFEAGNGHPTIEEIADEAHLSERSIYRYFDDRSSLITAAFGEVVRRALPHLEFADLGVGPFDDRVERFVMHRLTLYEQFGAIALVAMRAAPTDAVLAEQFELGSGLLRQQFLDHFDPELSELSAIDRTRATTLATLAFQFESFEYLHAHLDGGRDSVHDLLADQLRLNLSRFRSRAND